MNRMLLKMVMDLVAEGTPSGGNAPAPAPAPAVAAELTPAQKAAVAEMIAEARAKAQGDRKPVTKNAEGLDATPGITPGIEMSETRDTEPGWKFARYARAVMTSRLVGKPVLEVSRELAKADRRHGEIVRLLEDQERTQKALGASLLSEGASLLPPASLYQDYIDLLRPAVIVRAMGALEIPVPTGTMNLGRIDSDATASYIGENTGPNASQPGTGELKFSAKKLMCVVPIGNDFLRRGGAGADAIVRKGIRARAAVREDSAFIRGDGASDTPKGILNWIAAGNKFNSAGNTVDNVNSDLSKARRYLKNANTPMIKPGWMFSPRTEEFIRSLRDSAGSFLFKAAMDQGMLDGYPYKTSTQIPDNLVDHESEIYLVDFSEVLIGDTMALQVDAFDGASYKDSTGTLQSGLTNDQTVVRLIAEHDLIMQHSTSGVVIQAVHYGV